MRNTDAEKQLREAWNRKLDNYDSLLKLYKGQGYVIKRNDKTGDHIVESKSKNPFAPNDPFHDIFGGLFK